ncbi:unnamed protein product [Spirodela intermedia]|uniref:Uncharacterized protein n=1 Tax=Spirodela intermedia TaxID=51605 RepID=A0A7I8IJQ2_SPIIN|nr:unnamed protein product [Spirodela intermedia]CAA6657990.1 unnamed protein product [Spirodela intermedia]
MAADVVIDPQPANSCCAELRKRYVKLEEKRNALRQAVKLLENQTNKLQDETIVLKRAYEEERTRAEQAQLLNKESLEIKHKLDKEVRQLKSEIASLKESGSSVNQGKNQQLIPHISEGDAEIKRLKELLQKEIRRGDFEKKKVEEERNKAAEAWRLLKMEKKKVEDEKRISEMEREKAEDFRNCLEESRSEANEAREKLIAEKSKTDAAKKKLEFENKKTQREKKRADSERAKVEEQMRQLEIERKKLVDEKAISDHLSKQAQEFSELWNKMIRNEDAETANVKLLKDKIKFQRKQLKHAKKMAKLHEAEEHLLLQQLCLLNQDHMQFSHRLEMLTSCFPYVIDGTDGLAKAGKALKQRVVKPQKTFSCAEHDVNSQIEAEKTKNICTPMEYHGTSLPCTWHFPQTCGGSIRPVSGICSDLESPVRDSVRDKSQSSVICSTDVTFSDTQFLGSQGRSALAVATSAKLDTNLRVSPSINFTGEETKNSNVVQRGKKGRTFPREMKVPISKSISRDRNELAISDSQCIGAKRKAKDILDGGDCRWGLKTKNKIRVVENNLNPETIVSSLSRGDLFHSSKGRKHLATELSDDSDTRYCAERQNNISWSSEQNGMCNEGYGYEPEVKCTIRKSHALSCFDDMNHDDYMKLLDLDDEIEEKRFQEARRMLLSPNLPEIKSPISKYSADECLNCSSQAFGGSIGTEKERFGPVVRFNPHQGSTSQDHENRSTMFVESMTQKALPKNKEISCPNAVDRYKHRVYDCVVIFSNTKDEQMLCRILHAMDTILQGTSWAYEDGFLFTNVLHALTRNVDISAEEKVSVVYSLLLCKMSALISVDGGISVVKDLSLASQIFVAEADRVISDADTRSVFLKTCQLDIFFRLIQDFLVTRKLMVCEDCLLKPSDICTPDGVCHFNDGNKAWILKTATTCQLVAGSVILASMSVVLSCIDILWHTSYQLIRLCMTDSHWILTAVHVFASISGPKFFSSPSSNFISSVVKVIVHLLESGLEFSAVFPCMECPFAEGEVCLDKVTSLLLEELQDCAACTAKPLDPKTSDISSSDELVACTNRTNPHDENKARLDGAAECDHACSLQNLAHQLDNNADTKLCHFTDILSLLELIGHYMGWQWLRRRIIPQLFRLSESCTSFEFSVPLLILIGQFIRIGVEVNACEEEESEGLMSSLSEFLDGDGKGKIGSLPIQFAAVKALLGLLPLDFREIILSRGSFDVALRGSHAACAELVRRWFSQLGEDQISAAIGFFEELG